MDAKHIVVTGATSGLGAATRRLLIERGDRVVGMDRTNLLLGDVFVDVANFNQMAYTTRLAVDRLGGKVDAVIHCAGVNRPNSDASPLKSFSEVSADDWDYLIDINLKGTANVTRAFLPYLLRNDGLLVLVGSVEVYNPMANFSAYVVSKAGVAMLARCLQLDEPDLRVTLLSPGGMDTGFMNDLSAERRAEFMRPENVAKLILAAIDQPRDCTVSEIVVKHHKR